MLTLKSDENGTFFNAFKTRLVNSLGKGTFLWHKIIGENVTSPSSSKISYHLQIVPVRVNAGSNFGTVTIFTVFTLCWHSVNVV